MERELRGVILQHEETAPPQLFADWLDDREIAHEVRRAWEAGPPDDPAAYGWICALGSDATPGTRDAPPWVEPEITFLRRALERDVPILGLCFGAQALAAAAGASIHVAEPAEVGWAPIESADEELIARGPWLHFHYAQLELPRGAIELARSEAGTAAYRLGRSLGLQFHPEVTPELALGWARAERERLASLGIEVEAIAAGGERHGRSAAVAARRLFDGWWSRFVRLRP